MPRLLSAITLVGIVAMLWVGGHILLVGVDELGWQTPYDAVLHVEDAAHEAAGALGGVAGWLVNTLASAAVGAVVGAAVVTVLTLVGKARGRSSDAAH
jgi:predicted DNA repair protein MutK